MKVGWGSDRRDILTQMELFRAKVNALAQEMFDPDDDGELPVYIRITDRTLFSHSEKTDPDRDYDVATTGHRKEAKPRERILASQ